ncbi:translation initiation factor eIF2B subunit alpha-like [Clytia hemisphaerica]|uniref:Translation initiation factor eIF2B subunit alpha n=1 Tax=Clytia hemisphaerica TaxID=252671 RepID=A0A7M5XMF1_9CNID|eukprot:TCONS_00057436-protein
MSTFEAVKYFRESLRKDPELSIPLAAIKTLIKIIEVSEEVSLQGLDASLKTVIKDLENSSDNSITSITSGCELLQRFITLAAPDALLSKDFSECKKVLAMRGKLFLQQAHNSRNQISKLSQQFIQDGCVILIHARSRVIIHLLVQAAKMNKKFTVYVTESMPDQQGLETKQILEQHNISCKVILDSSVGFIMERVDMVLLGAEAVVESGGIINKIGTFQMAVTAKAMNKPVYVAAESFKFLREYPLKQTEVSNKYKYFKNCENGHPSVDYTPPSYIALLFTDLGVLTPSAVSDELIKLYL